MRVTWGETRDSGWWEEIMKYHEISSHHPESPHSGDSSLTGSACYIVNEPIR